MFKGAHARKPYLYGARGFKIIYFKFPLAGICPE